MIADDALAGLDEFALLSENAAQAGVSSALPSVVRVERGPISALRWGSDSARVIFLHGGGQNAHTWDTVILGLGLPALAIDLPGHGRSAWREDGDYGPKLNAEAVAPVIKELAPDAQLVVGMSLGGLTAMRLAVTTPALVRELVMIDVTPSRAGPLFVNVEINPEQKLYPVLKFGNALENQMPYFSRQEILRQMIITPFDDSDYLNKRADQKSQGW